MRLTPVTHCTMHSSQEYHIHTSWTDSRKNSAATSLECSKTGLHYDPYLACGYLSSDCTALKRNTTKGYTCTPPIYNSGQYAKCQVGDTSGKFGNAVATSGLKFEQLSPLYDYHPPVAANYLVGTSRTSTFSSVVFHCPGTNARLLCAKLNLIPAGQSSVCSFPGAPVDATAQVQSDLDKSKDMVYKATIAFIILAIIAFILLLTTIILSAQLCCKKKSPALLAAEEKPAQAIVGNY